MRPARALTRHGPTRCEPARRAPAAPFVRTALVAFLLVPFAVLGAPAFADDPPGKQPAPTDEPTTQEPTKDEPSKDPPLSTGDEPKDGATKPKSEKAETPPRDEPHVKKANGTGGGADVRSPAAGKSESRLERTKRLVRELEISVESARAARPRDAELVRALEESLEIARLLATPVTLADLSEEERRGVTDEVKKQLEPVGLPEKNPLADPLRSWEENAVAKAFDGADLGDEEQVRARAIISEWFASTGPARREADWKRVNDLKRDRDDKLVQALGKKKAQKVIHNLNAMSGWGPGRK